MRDLAEFGTGEHCLHPSSLFALVTCPWRIAMKYLTDFSDDEHGAAGDTGSAVHVAVAAMHRGKGAAACLEHMRENSHKYPMADLLDAADMFLKYAQDSRNRSAEIVLVEQPISFSIKAAPEDETQAPIQITGTLDQVRFDGSSYRVWDVKTSKKDAYELLNQHTLQIAAYTVGACMILNREVHPGGLILTRKYKDKNPSEAPVFWHYPWTSADLQQILAPVQHIVARIRAGVVWHMPGPLCAWCHMKSPDLCLPELQRLNAVRG